jgi:phosphate transport system protein
VVPGGLEATDIAVLFEEPFRDELVWLSDRMVTMSRLAQSGMGRATASLLRADLTLAQGVISDDRMVDALRADIEQGSVRLLEARPLATVERKAVLAVLRMATHLERMGDLARHVAKLARLRYPHQAIPAELHHAVQAMSDVAERIAVRTTAVIAGWDAVGAADLEIFDDEMDRLHRESFAMVLDPEWGHGVATAIDITLVARYYERFADHAVAVGRQLTPPGPRPSPAPDHSPGRAHRAAPRRVTPHT